MDMTQTRVAALSANAGDAREMDVRFVAGEAYEVRVRGHRLVVDQPAGAGGQDTAPTPTELFVASLATCVAFYAGRYLMRHGYSRDGLAVSAGYEMAGDRPARVRSVRLAVRVPAGLPPGRWAALRAVASRCTVHNSLTVPPSVTIDVM
jgi:putative redox protein